MHDWNDGLGFIYQSGIENKERKQNMTSLKQKMKAIRKWKDRPNKANQKADLKRNQANAEILREFAAKDKA